MFNQEMRYALTIAEIEYSDSIESHWDLFHQGIGILKARLEKGDVDRDFTDEERDVLEEIFSIMGDEQ